MFPGKQILSLLSRHSPLLAPWRVYRLGPGLCPSHGAGMYVVTGSVKSPWHPRCAQRQRMADFHSEMLRCMGVRSAVKGTQTCQVRALLPGSEGICWGESCGQFLPLWAGNGAGYCLCSSHCCDSPEQSFGLPASTWSICASCRRETPF